MKTRILSLALLGALVGTTTVSAQQFVPVPNSSLVTDITADGSMVVGNGTGGAFYWRWQAEPAPTFIGENGAVAVSDDGSVILGRMNDPILNVSVAGLWTQSTGWVSLGALDTCGSGSSPYGMSADGSKVVGLSWSGCSGRGFVWDSVNGMQELDNQANGNNRASAISADGTVIGGFAQGTSTRTPAYWDPADLTGFMIDPSIGGEVNAFTSDGSLSVGTIYAGGSWNNAFTRTSAGAVTILGALNPGQMAGVASAVSENEQTIAGYDVAGLSKEGWVWRSTDGIISMNDRLTALGATNVPPISTAVALSDDGSVVVGAYDPDGISFSAGYIALLNPYIEPWTDLGGGIAGINGVPQLSGDGNLVGGTTVTLNLVNAPPSTTMLAWMAFAPSNIPYFGGTVFTLPFNTQIIVPSSPAGTFSASTTWPIGVPQGTDVWFQFAMQDLSVVQGITISNGVKATTP